MITARVLGVELRGTLALMLSVGGLVVLLAALGTNVAIRRRLPRGENSVKQYIAVSAAIFLGLALLAPIAAFLMALWVDPSFKEFQVSASFVGYAVAFFWSNQMLDLLNALGKMPLAAGINAAGTLICLVLIFSFTTMGGGIGYVGLSYIVSMCFQAIVAWILVGRIARPVSESTESRWALIRSGTMMMGLNLGQAITYRADTVIISALSSPYAVGLYAVATTPAALLRLPATAVGQVLFYDTARGRASLRQVWQRVVWVEVILLFMAAAGWLLADVAIVLLFGEAFSMASGVFRVLLIAELALAPFLVLSRVLVGRGGTWHASVPGIAGAVALVGSGIVLVPELGAYGGAWASVFAYSLMSAVTAVQVFMQKDRLTNLEES